MEESEIDLRGLLGVLRRQLRLILVTLVAVVAAAVIGAFALTPVFSASALILVDPSGKNLLDPQSEFSSAGADSARIDSEVEILRSDSILLRVVSSQQLVADSEFGPSLGWRERLMAFLRLSDQQLPTGEDALNGTLSKLRNAVQVQRRGLTYLISVQAKSTNPETSARLANALADAYISEQLNSKIGSVLASRDILNARVNQARAAIVDSESSFDGFIEGNIDRISKESGSANLAQIQREIEALSAARQNDSALAAAARASLEQEDFQTLVATLQSDALSSLQAQREQLSATLANADSDSPAAADLRNQLAQINESLLNEARSQVDNLQSTVSLSEQREESLRQDLRSQVLRTNLSADVLTEIYSLQQSSEIARAQYQTLLSRVQDLDTQANLQVADSRIVSPALSPQSPAFPNRRLIIVLAGLFGLGLGVALAFLYENLIGGFTSEEQIEAVLKTRFASAVPLQNNKGDNQSYADLLIDKPLSIYAESIRRIRLTLDKPGARALGIRNGTQSKHAKCQVVMVSSAAPNDGKSTVALALARSYSLTGQSTLLIDCDLRKPSLHRHLNLSPSKGLQEFLGSSDEDNQVIKEIMATDPLLPSLNVILGDRQNQLPTDQLLAGVTFGRLIEAARKTFDVVIIDTPPVGPVVDGLYIAPFADVIVFVARWAATSQTDAKRAIESLRASKNPETEIVAVLNQQNESRSSYKQKYGQYYTAAY
ncbi:Wzz/FepE/Etk N-terminal domain-containing protein [Devosia sp. J2-20]|uniref:GumC family protein n=1 Tax=Devosia sp. J2-20 TaxID=3026161 RepID=UPI00249A9AA4|nr:Wzz/FepE/Etk N-terminal domain-containing protein [Devosia sp. J2-20]WDQ98395.1 Wzz/FepE/Etk N-terminal domain-containing protein [Devosia sp. J2-20]